MTDGTMEKELIIRGNPGPFLRAIDYFLSKEHGPKSTKDGAHAFFGYAVGDPDSLSNWFGYFPGKDRGWFHIHTIPDGVSLLQVSWDDNRSRIAELWASIEEEMKRQGFIVDELKAVIAKQKAVKRSEFLKKLREVFSEDDAEDICFELHIDYADLPAQGRKNKLRELVAEVEHRECLPDFIKILKRERPNVDWDEFTSLE